jgi:hypothetical protein
MTKRPWLALRALWKPFKDLLRLFLSTPGPFQDLNIYTKPYVFQLRSMQCTFHPSHFPCQYPIVLSGSCPILAQRIPYGLLKENWLIGLDKAAKPMRCEWALGSFHRQELPNHLQGPLSKHLPWTLVLSPGPAWGVPEPRGMPVLLLGSC